MALYYKRNLIVNKTNTLTGEVETIIDNDDFFFSVNAMLAAVYWFVSEYKRSHIVVDVICRQYYVNPFTGKDSITPIHYDETVLYELIHLALDYLEYDRAIGYDELNYHLLHRNEYATQHDYDEFIEWLDQLKEC